MAHKDITTEQEADARIAELQAANAAYRTKKARMLYKSDVGLLVLTAVVVVLNLIYDTVKWQGREVAGEYLPDVYLILFIAFVYQTVWRVVAYRTSLLQ